VKFGIGAGARDDGSRSRVTVFAARHAECVFVNGRTKQMSAVSSPTYHASADDPD
jgi:hypothetical protein